MYLTNINVKKDHEIPYTTSYHDDGCTLTACVDLPPYMAGVDMSEYQTLCMYARYHEDVAQYLRCTLPSLSRREVVEELGRNTTLSCLANQEGREDDYIHFVLLARGATYELQKRDWLEREGLHVQPTA